jgi:hypothetical protein
MMMVVIGKHFHEKMYYMEYQGNSGRYRRLAEVSNKAMKFSYGIYMSLLAGLLSFVGGSMMLCQGCGSSDDGEDYYDTGYQQGNQQQPIVRENAYC